MPIFKLFFLPSSTERFPSTPIMLKADSIQFEGGAVVFYGTGKVFRQAFAPGIWEEVSRDKDEAGYDYDVDDEGK